MILYPYRLPTWPPTPQCLHEAFGEIEALEATPREIYVHPEDLGDFLKGVDLAVQEKQNPNLWDLPIVASCTVRFPYPHQLQILPTLRKTITVTFQGNSTVGALNLLAPDPNG